MIETEMSDCLEQMAKLQEKMERLQEEKNKQAAEEVLRLAPLQLVVFPRKVVFLVVPKNILICAEYSLFA